MPKTLWKSQIFIKNWKINISFWNRIPEIINKASRKNLKQRTLIRNLRLNIRIHVSLQRTAGDRTRFTCVDILALSIDIRILAIGQNLERPSVCFFLSLFILWGFSVRFNELMPRAAWRHVYVPNACWLICIFTILLDRSGERIRVVGVVQVRSRTRLPRPWA